MCEPGVSNYPVVLVFSDTPWLDDILDYHMAVKRINYIVVKPQLWFPDNILRPCSTVLLDSQNCLLKLCSSSNINNDVRRWVDRQSKMRDYDHSIDPIWQIIPTCRSCPKKLKFVFYTYIIFVYMFIWQSISLNIWRITIKEYLHKSTNFDFVL